MQRPADRAGIQRSGGSQRPLGIQTGKGPNLRLAIGDARQASRSARVVAFIGNNASVVGTVGLRQSMRHPMLQADAPHDGRQLRETAQHGAVAGAEDPHGCRRRRWIEHDR